MIWRTEFSKYSEVSGYFEEIKPDFPCEPSSDCDTVVSHFWYREETSTLYIRSKWEIQLKHTNI